MLRRFAAPGSRFEDVIGEDQVFAYARKSNEDRSALRSIEDQHAINLETALEWGLPLQPENMLSEKPGHGGDEWWSGGGATGIEGDHTKATTRPELTKLVRGVVTGNVKVIVVWSMCRLWRDVGICEAMIKLLARHECRLYDRNGPVDIHTPEGRQAVRANAIAGQNMREMAAVNSPRGVRRSRGKGKSVVSCNRLGFRSIRGTGNVRHIPEEQDMVRQIYRWYDEGMTVSAIALELTNKGFQYLPDIKRGGGEEPRAIYPETIKKLLSDCRYQGRIPHEGEEWSCPELLVAGEPVVPVALWERVQKKLEQCRPGAPGHRTSHALAGIIRCGICGQSMRRLNSTYKLANGSESSHHNWHGFRSNMDCWCTHVLPTLQVDDVDGYVAEILQPLLLAELQERTADSQVAEILDEKSRTERSLSQVEKRLADLAQQWARGELESAEYRDARRAAAIYEEELKATIRCLERSLLETGEFSAALQKVGQGNEGAVKDAIREVLAWIAVIPSDIPERVSRSYHNRPQAKNGGWVVFCTAWGTLHTACIERRSSRVEGAARSTRRNFLRQATFAESIGTVAEFPEPHAFVAGLAYYRTEKPWRAGRADVTPGYIPGRNDEVEVVAFDVEGWK